MKIRRAPLQVSVHVGDLNGLNAQALMVGVFDNGDVGAGLLESLESHSNVSLKSLIAAREIRGEFKEYTLVHLGESKPVARVILMGMGKRSDFYLDKIRSAAAKAARTLRRAHVSEMVVAIGSFPGFTVEAIAQAVAEGTVMGLYRARKYSERDDHRGVLDKLILWIEKEEDRAAAERGARDGSILADAVLLCRDLANEPGNLMTPSILAGHAEKVAAEHGLDIMVWGRKEIYEHQMGGIIAVSKGSEEDPRFVVMKYHGGGENAPTIAYVGKGITFDSGGISIKPAERMGHMKYDMAGAAAVISTMKAIAQLQIPINVLGIVPACENLPDGKAYKPGDVIKMYGPKYVEIVNTDAEGRMILADALHYACQQKPELIVDVATLTGGCVIALGTMVTGVMSNNDWLTRQLIDSGMSHEEKMWRLPLFPEYDIQIRSSVADISNSGGRPASASTAAKFLQEFVDRPWAHLDIAGTAWIEEDNSQYSHQPYLPQRGATGWGVRTLTVLAQMLADASGSNKEKLQELLKQ